MRRAFALSAFGTTVLCLSLAIAARGGEPAPRPMLHLMDGGFVAGDFADSPHPGRLRWQAASFSTPFEFFTDGINSVDFPSPAAPPRPVGDYYFELAGGDVLFGSLISLDAKTAELDVPRLSRVHVDRTNIRRLDRWGDRGEWIYVAPNGLNGWHEPAPRKGWREEFFQLLSQKPGASIRGDLRLPARAVVEFELSWTNKPDFVLALGVGDDAASVEQAFRFEAWDNELVVLRETETEADVAPLGAIARGPGHARFQAYVDQERGRIVVVSAVGRLLTDMTVSPSQPRHLTGVALVNKGRDLRLERLRISRWSGDPPRESRADLARIHLKDGSILYGQDIRFDAVKREFAVRSDGAESRVPEGRVSSVFLSPGADEPSRSLRAVCQDGTRLSGDLLKVERGELWLTIPGIAETLRLPATGLHSLTVLRHPTRAFDRSGKGPIGFLLAEGVKLGGRLRDGRGEPEATCLAWQPTNSTTASPLRPGFSGQIVYRDSSAPAPTPVPRPSQPARVNAMVIRGRAVQPAPQPVRSVRVTRALHLRTGDVIPCQVTKIDEKGVWIRTPHAEGTSVVPHAKVQAIVLRDELLTIDLSASKRERLLTLPRLQKANPPTHLILSKSNDYLRGRVVAMDDERLQLEVRTETKAIPRDRVAQIIWLHSEERAEPRADTNAGDSGVATLVQAVRRDGVRMTFAADRVADGTISGDSEVLGPFRVRLDQVDQILIGGAIERAAAQLAYQQWKLHDAVVPKAFDEEGAESSSRRTPGTDSALVGKPAPDFELHLLGNDGKRFKLSESKGKVVVLDFWATWCGPCLQAMPQVERVAKEFADRDVRLVAVNLQESPEKISAMLQRHRLEVTVAMDRDGVVAERYEAHAIPQTVVIDREGKIARLFVGGGPRLGDQLRQALQALVPSDKPVDPR